MKYRALSITIVYVLLLLLVSQTAFAASTGGGGPPGGGGSDSETPSQLCDLLGIVAKTIKIIAPAAGIAFFLMLIYAGYKYIFSFGNPGGAGQARGAITTALIGVVVLLLVYAIFKSLELVTGINLLNYTPAGTLCNI